MKIKGIRSVGSFVVVLVLLVAPRVLAQSGTEEAARPQPEAKQLQPPAQPEQPVIPPSPVEPVAAPASVGLLRLEDIPARREELTARLENLRRANLPKEELEKAEAAFGRVLKMAADLEDAAKRQAEFQKATAEIPQRLQELEREQRARENAKPPEFDDYTDGLRAEYAAKLKAFQAEVENLTKESSQGDIRVVRIPEEIRELESRSAELGARLQELGYGPGPAPEDSEAAPLSEIQETALERQLVRTRIAALEAEREWLTQRRPLQDRLVALARLRASNAERDLGVISERLLETIAAKRSKLREQLAEVDTRMTESESRADTMLLAIRRATIEVQLETLDLIEKSKGLRTDLLEEEKLTVRMNQDKDRLTALMEKYGAGEWVAQRVMMDVEAFRLAGEAEVQNAAPEAKLEEQLREANKHLFEIGTELFELDDGREEFLRELNRMAPEVPPARLRALRSDARRLTEEQKEALQQQEQVLTERVQALTKLIELDRQQENLVKGLYSFVVTRILWLRNREPLGPYPVNFERFKMASDAAVSYARRVYVYIRGWGMDRVRVELRGTPFIAFIGVFLLLPFAAIVIRRRAKARVAAILARSADTEATPGLKSFFLLLFIAAVWPAYIFLLVRVWPWFVPSLDPVGFALKDTLHLSALVLGVLVFSRHLLKPNGWAMQYWGPTPEALRLLRWSLRLACYAGFLFLVPYHVVLFTPELGGTVEASLVLARVLMIAFQLVLMILLAVLLRRNGAFTQWLLGRSHQQHGFLWQTWPIAYLLVLAAIAGIVCLDVLGYNYAATFFWRRAVISLSIATAIWGVFAAGRSLIAAFVRRQSARARAVDGSEGAIRWLVASFGIPLLLAGVAAILEVWGFSVLDFMATPLGTTLLWRAIFIAAAVAVAVIIIQLTNAVVMSLLAPKIMAEGRTREAGRKLQTIGPLTQTIVKVAVILIAFLIVLEQVGIATGPILAGVGIFGLAIGFAAQSLIKDVINGLFILFEGSLAVGEIVSVGGIGGQVEKVTLRSVRVRDLAGNVHFIPNSTIERVENMTKDFSRYLMEVGVAYREDTDEVVHVMKEVDEEMRNDPVFKWEMLEPIEILGVDRFADSAVVIKARLKTRPMQQWRTGREFNRRLKKAFDRQGIEIPFPHRTVYWGETKQGQRPLQVDMDNNRGLGAVQDAGSVSDHVQEHPEAEAKKEEKQKTGT